MWTNFDRLHEQAVEQINLIPDKPFQRVIWGKPPMIWAGSVKNCEHVLKSVKTYHLPQDRQEIFKELFGKGIFASNGPEWKLHRKAGSHIFTMNNLRDLMSETFIKHGNGSLTQVLDSAITNKITVDLQNLLFRYTMDCFSTIAFGEECNTLGAKEVGFARAFDSCQNNMVLRIFTPYWKILRILGLQAEGQIKKDLVAIDEHVRRIIQQRNAKTEGKEQKLTASSDLISHYISFYTRSLKVKDGPSAKQIRDTVTNFMIAG